MKNTIEAIKIHVNLAADVENAILHHHEYVDGSGPLGIQRNQIHPIGHLIRIADEITSKLLRSPENPNPLNLHQALALLNNSKRFIQRVTDGFSFNKPTNLI